MLPREVDRRTRRPKALWLFLALLAALLIAVYTFEAIAGGGHPSLSALLLFWASYPTLTGYLSRALLGHDFPPTVLLFIGLLEYPLVGIGLASLIARFRGRGGPRAAIVALLIYASAQVAVHFVLNLQSVNLRLIRHESPAVSIAAVHRIRESGNAAAVPALQQKLLDDFARQGHFDSGLLDALTALGGARGWQDLLGSGRLAVAGRGAWAWGFIVENVRAMANPLFAEPRGGVKSPYFRDEDIARLFDAIALSLAERLQAAPDSEASLTLLVAMKERPDLCQKYFQYVPIGLRDLTPQQATQDLVTRLALIKAGPSADGKYDYQEMIVKDETSRFFQDRDAVADEWIAWAKSNATCR
jgi:hypothetical protein